MKKGIFLLAALTLLSVSICFADAWDDAIHKAQALKKTGDYAGAAEATPRSLCKAMYYWNAACKVVGHRDANHDWAINAELTEAQKTEGLRLLKLASDSISDASLAATAVKDGKKTSPDDGTCAGVDVVELDDLIAKVTDCINGHCQ